MKVNIIAQGMELTSAISEYIDKKLSHLDKLIGNDESAMATVEVGKTTQHHNTGPFYKAEIRVRIAGKNFMHVAEAEDLYAAIDAMKDAIGEEVTSHMDRKKVLARDGGREIKKLMHTAIGE